MQSKMRKITIGSPSYPKLLAAIPEAPKILYVIGRLPEEKYLAVVGTRNCSNYGKEATLKIAGDLAEAGLIIVSGLAPGIDTFAHRAALERGGKTIAVLGTGLDEKSIYPSENVDLSRKIVAAGGALVSEYPPGTKGSKFTFPRRNRIVSGLSLGILVIEAKEKSGSLITANYAKKHKRKLFALPGQITSLNSAGTNKLIKHGAKLTENAGDVLQELKLPAFDKKDKINYSRQSSEEKAIFETLKNGSRHIDKIIEGTGLAPAAVAGTLAMMEAEGKIRNLGANIYAINHC